MSGSQKAIKVLSIISIVFGVIGIVFGLLAFAGAGVIGNQMVTYQGVSYSAGALSIAGGFMLLIDGILDIVVGWLGLRGAKDPAKIGPFYVLCWIEVILVVVGFACMLFNGAAIGNAIVSLVGNIIVPLILLILARNIKNQA